MSDEQVLTNRMGELLDQFRKEVLDYLNKKIKTDQLSDIWLLIQYQLTMVNTMKLFLDSVLDDLLEMMRLLGIKTIMVKRDDNIAKG